MFLQNINNKLLTFSTVFFILIDKSTNGRQLIEIAPKLEITLNFIQKVPIFLYKAIYSTSIYQKKIAFKPLKIRQ
ncbi:MAG TPA: hypothetical protein DDW93_10050 [Firmicutes bacterium]|nr:hypothetical protein [Bacillota bacterium]HBK67724.1 hypothetical protein [Bacillota bacterium]HBT17017.1 hypothetical protein [Bacillota bacterium]